jgi:hypothetical protein
MTKTTPRRAKAKDNQDRSSGSPFKDIAILEKEIAKFASRFKAVVVNQAKRISDYFEMSCYNQIVKWYEYSGYSVSVENLIAGRYKYKCTTTGYPSNFSYFKVNKTYKGIASSFEIHHNLAVQSSHDFDIYTTPDISIIKEGSIQDTEEYYDTAKRFFFVASGDLVTFGEVKNFNPFPELLFNFIGVLNELKKEYMLNEGVADKPAHIAPSLMMSGKPSKHAALIKERLESRYCVNIIDSLFYSGTTAFTRTGVGRLRKTGKAPRSISVAKALASAVADIDVEDHPF